jgi:hypothetical protein
MELAVLLGRETQTETFIPQRFMIFKYMLSLAFENTMS